MSREASDSILSSPAGIRETCPTPPTQNFRSGTGARNASGKNPTLAAFLSAIVPGLGQFYNGDVKKDWIRLAIAVVGGSATYGLAWFA